jgi:hypothetical protein
MRPKHSLSVLSDLRVSKLVELCEDESKVSAYQKYYLTLSLKFFRSLHACCDDHVRADAGQDRSKSCSHEGDLESILTRSMYKDHANSFRVNEVWIVLSNS